MSKSITNTSFLAALNSIAVKIHLCSRSGVYHQALYNNLCSPFAWPLISRRVKHHPSNIQFARFPTQFLNNRVFWRVALLILTLVNS